MGLVEKLEREAKVIEPWSGYEYVQVRADLRELLEQAASRIRELESPMLIRLTPKEAETH